MTLTYRHEDSEDVSNLHTKNELSWSMPLQADTQSDATESLKTLQQDIVTAQELVVMLIKYWRCRKSPSRRTRHASHMHTSRPADIVNWAYSYLYCCTL